MTDILIFVFLGGAGALLAWRIVAARRQRFLAGRLGIDLAAPALEARRAAGETIEASAGVLSHAAGLSPLGRMYASFLQRAGVPYPRAATIYLAAKLVGVLGVAAAEALVLGPGFWAGGGRLWLFLLSCAGAWFVPDLFLYMHVVDRRNKLRKGLPVWLDLHTTLVEGGMGFDAALARIVSETERSKDPIFRELARTQKELLVGSDRAGALRRMAERIRIEEFEQVVAALVQADRIGAGIVSALRAQGDMIRNKIWEEARAKAEKLPTKLLFPIFLGIMPMFVVLVMLPLALRIVLTIKGIR